MYASLKDWMNLPLKIKPFKKRTGDGTRLYYDDIDTFCYAEGKVQLTTGSSGAEVVSKKQLYVEGNVQISSLDNIIFDDFECDIISVENFYDINGISLKVVYL